MADLAVKFILASVFWPVLKLQRKGNVECKRLGYRKISDTGETKNMPEFITSGTSVEDSQLFHAWSHNIIINSWFLGQNGWDWMRGLESFI